MKTTGELKFVRDPQSGAVTHEWSGGRRVAITSALLEVIFGPDYPRVGKVFEMEGITLRIVGRAYDYGSYYDTYVVMQEGPAARFVCWTNQKAVDWAPRLFTWECYVLRFRKPVGGEHYPKRSIVRALTFWL